MSQYSLTECIYSDITKISSDKFQQLPFTIKIFLENCLRHLPEGIVNNDHISTLMDWNHPENNGKEIPFFPSRVLLQDLSGVPLIVDLAAMRDMIADWGGDPLSINPYKPIEAVIDHSIMVDAYGSAQAHEFNKDKDYERNLERYEFFKWAQQSLQNVKIVPPDTGIVHQINIEYLARGIFTEKQSDGKFLIYPDTVVGTDSHTTMVNGLGILGWGVGGIEAEAVALGQPIPLTIPQVIGVRLVGQLKPGVTATDFVLTLTQQLRAHGVVGQFVEFFGPGLSTLSIADRVTVSNMSPEFGSTAALFPCDQKTMDYFRMTGRSEEHCQLMEAYFRNQGLFWTDEAPEPEFTTILVCDLSAIEPCLAGPSRPQDRIPLKIAHESWRQNQENSQVSLPSGHHLKNGDVVIAAITSCTNTSNPHVLITAGLLAQAANEHGLKTAAWVKTSLAPGSQTVTTYLKNAGLLSALEALGFFVVGYGCTTCIGNSGPLNDEIAQAISAGNLNVCSVLSGNRNFEARIHPSVASNYLASPPLVVAYALAGTLNIDWENEPIGISQKTHQPIYLKDLWPARAQVDQIVHAVLSQKLYHEVYSKVFEGDARWKAIATHPGTQYRWNETSTYLKRPPYLTNCPQEPAPLEKMTGARVLARFGDSITTDHISPAGTIAMASPAGQYLQEHGVPPALFNSYGSRRGHDEIMIRGTFANSRLKNLCVAPKLGGWTRYWPTNEECTIFDASMRYQKDHTPLVIVAGKEYGSGSSRDWAAKGTKLLGVKAILAESYERIHRSNLIGMGVIPLEFLKDQDELKRSIVGDEQFDIEWNLSVRGLQLVKMTRKSGELIEFPMLLRIDTSEELAYLHHGGILPYVLRKMLKESH